MKKVLQKMTGEKKYSIILAVGITVSIVPLFIVAFYNHMYNDDFAYAYTASQIIKKGNGWTIIGNLILNAFESAANAYMTWSGCYSSYFFSAIAPYIWGDKFTFLNTFILLGGFLILNGISAKIILKDLLNVKQDYALGIICLYLGALVHFVPSTAEAYYWFNGAFYNIIGYSAGLLLFVIVLKVLICRQKLIIWKYVVTMSVLSVFFTGTNYSSMLVYMVLYALILLVIICKRKEMDKSRTIVLLSIIALFYIGCAVSILAPGNSVRQATGDPSLPPFKAIAMALMSASDYIRRFNSMPFWTILLLGLPLIIKAVSEMEYDFRHPIIVAGFSYILLAVSITPTMFSMGTVGPLRTQNMYLWFFVLFAYLNLFYLVGWITHRVKMNVIQWTFEGLIQWAGVLILAFIVVVPVGKWHEIAGVAATKSFVRGEVQTYDKEILERYVLYYDEEILDVEFESLSCNPIIISVREDQGITEDSNWYVNQSVARYFGKKTVRVSNK